MSAPSKKSTSPSGPRTSSSSSGTPSRTSSSGAPPGPRPASPQLSPMASSSSSPSPGLSPIAPVGGSPSPATPVRPGLSPFLFGQGHGAYSEKGGLKKGKTEIRPSAVASVNEQRTKAISGGTIPGGAGPVNVSFVPRRSDPTKFRAIATKTGSGGPEGPTSFPLGLDVTPSSLATAGLRADQVVHDPNSPPPSPRGERKEK